MLARGHRVQGAAWEREGVCVSHKACTLAASIASSANCELHTCLSAVVQHVLRAQLGVERSWLRVIISFLALAIKAAAGSRAKT